MGLEESLRQISTEVQDGDFSISIRFNRLERQFTDKNRMLMLYSDVDYKAENFEWSSTIPTVKIPYCDPALGFLVDGKIFSTVGIYSRAPGIVPDVEKRTLNAKTIEEPKVDIVNARNSTISIGYKRNAVQIVFKRNMREYRVPMGVFLKALSGLPYAVILEKFAYKPQALLNSFPCEVPKGSEDLSRTNTYGIESEEEPSISDCVDAVYAAITQTRDNTRVGHYTTHWKVNRINTFFNNLHFKTRQKYEATLSVGHRAVGTYLDADICVPYFKREVITEEKKNPLGGTTKSTRIVETVEEFKLPKGHYITDDDAREIRRYDIDRLRVKTTRSFVLQEDSPMFFRAKGYKLVNDIPSINANAGDIIDDELLAKINDTDICYLDVNTPGGRKVLHRSGENVELGDFYSILNYLFTHPYMQKADTTQYEVGNRIILNYDKHVRMEVEQTYNDIVSSVIGSTELKNLLESFPSLPSNRLISYLNDHNRKEVSQSDITNIMSRAISDTKSSALMRESPAAMMPVQKGQYGRLDSFHAPDSVKVGSVQQSTILSRVNEETSEIEAPYERVINGKPTGEIVYITAAKENNKYIVAWDNDLTSPLVLARYNGDVTTVARERVDYRDPSPFCDMSVSRMCIPFPGFSQPKRALMATKMNGQAIPVLFPERPMVSTGADTEVPGLYYTGRKILELNNISVIEGKGLELVGHDWKKDLVEYKFIYNGDYVTFSLPFTATDEKSLYNYNLNLATDGKYGLDDVIFYNQSCDIKDYEFWTRIKQGTLPLFKDHTKPALALGVNLRVCYKTYGSSTVDDALLISNRLITDNTVSSIQIFKYTYKLRQNEYFSEANWCAGLYSHVYVGQPVIKISRMKGDRVSEREVLCKQEGEIVYASKDDSAKEAEVWVSTIHHAEIGDKMAGRYGNKSVIAKIVPEDMMPYDPDDGIPMDICCSPLGLPSRMNFGQVLEVALGAVMAKEHKIAVVTPFYPNIKQDVVDTYNQAGLKPKRLFNPEYGKLTERPVMTGILYMMKLEQISNLKIAAVGYPVAVDPVFGQPINSINQKNGQTIGEMETHALIASGAHNILNSFFSFYADDEEARRAYFDALEGNGDDPLNPWDESFLPKSRKSVNKNALVTQTVMRMFGSDLEVVDNKYVITPLNLDDIPVSETQEEFNNGYERVKDFEWFKVPLAAPVINPFWINNFPLHLVLGVKSVKTLADRKAFLDKNKLFDRENCILPASSVSEDERITMLTGVEAIIELVKNTTIDDAMARLRAKYDTSANGGSQSDMLDSDEVIRHDVVVLDNDSAVTEYFMLGDLADVPMNVADVLRFLERMKRNGMELSQLIWYEMPIMPKIFRQANRVGDREHEHSFQSQLKSICSSRATSQTIYEALKDFIGYGTAKKDDLVSIRGYFFGRGAQAGQHGKVRGSVLSKRVGFSGRVVIVPMEDPTISPFFVGLPWRAVMLELSSVLAIRISKHDHEVANRISQETSLIPTTVEKLEISDWKAIIESLGEYNPYLLGNYFKTDKEEDLYFIYHYLRSVIRSFVEGKVRNDGMVWYNDEWVDPRDLADDATLDCAIAMSGRQPTLHKKSIRSYFVKLVDGYCMRIHPIVCKAYNADFDGDTMWHVQLFGEDKIEACRTMSVMQDLISEKDGSYTLDLAQDVALGIYCATTYRDNAEKFEGAKGNFHYFDNLEELRTQLEYGDLHYYDAVVFYNKDNDSYYCSTAGRILVNGAVPGCFTQMPFSDKHGICTAVLGVEMKSKFKELLHDTVWTTTGERPSGRKEAVTLASILLDTYNSYGDRQSIMTAQSLYEIGLTASDVYSVTITLDDMSSTVDKQAFMEAPRKTVAQLNDLYQLGLISEESRKLASERAWNSAKDIAQDAIIKSLDPKSNTFYMLYSGARGKPAQLMQSVGFIGTISKTTTEDIEYPILKGYGEGLSSLDLAQTAPSARIGVISTQAGTKDTGYATRQSVYMTSGLTIKGHDCGIGMSLTDVDYSVDTLRVKWPGDKTTGLDALIGEFVSDTTEGFASLAKQLNLSGYMITQQIIDKIIQCGITHITLLDKEVELVYSVDDAWRKFAVENWYSYALPYTEDMKITDRTVDWIEEHGLKQVIAFSAKRKDMCFDRQAYMPVDYNTSKYTITVNGKKVDSEALYTMAVKPETPGIHYYKNLLTATGTLNEKAINYLTKKRIPYVEFVDGTRAEFSYQLSALFKETVLGRLSGGLPYLDSTNCITKETLSVIEEMQFKYIPVRTGLTCLARGGICSACYGKSLSSNMFQEDGYNLGIAASQAMCEPLSQATLNVAHSGGKRSGGTDQVSGLAYYSRMLQGSMTTERTASMMERFAERSGYIRQNPHNKSFIQIVDDNGEISSVTTDSADRLNVPDGAYVDANDTIITGLPDLHRYDSTNVFEAALKTRYLLMREYRRIFEGLKVSARNTEIMARAQTSICYLVGKGATAKTKDTGEEAANPTGNYKLMVSNQAQVVNWFSGIAGWGFENVANMLLMGLFTPEGLPLNSCLGNLITGTKVGSHKAKPISDAVTRSMRTTYHRSNVKEHQTLLETQERTGNGNTILMLGASDFDTGYSAESEDELLNKLLNAGNGQAALPEAAEEPVPAQPEEEPPVTYVVESVTADEPAEEEVIPTEEEPTVLEVDYVSVDDEAESEQSEEEEHDSDDATTKHGPGPKFMDLT